MTLPIIAPFKVIVADDLKLVTFAIAWAVKEAFGEVPLEVCETVEATWKACLGVEPLLLLISLSLRDKDTRPLIRSILEKSPGAKILVISSIKDHREICETIHLGVCGYFHQSQDQGRLVEALRELQRGRKFLCTVATEALCNTLMHNSEEGDSLESLKQQDVDFIKMITSGQTIKEISHKLNLSEKTVYAHRTKVLMKTKCVDTVSLTHYAIKQGLIAA